MEFAGEADKRTCRVWAELSDGTGIVEYVSPKFHAINPKNSPLWKNDPDQQLFYFSVRAFARRHFPDVMQGIFTVDEMTDNADSINVEARHKPGRIAERVIDHVTPTITHEPQQDSFQEDMPDRRQMEPAKAKTEQKTEAKRHAGPIDWPAKIEAASTEMELDQVADAIDIAQAKGELSPEDVALLTESCQTQRNELKKTCGFLGR